MSIRWGLLGFGKHAAKAVLPAFQECRSASLSTVGSARAEMLAEREPQPGISFTSYQEVLEDPSIDAIYIALPNHLHLQWCLRSFSAGKHVLCEKPLALNAEEASKILGAAQTSERFVAEAFMYRFHPQHQVIQRQLAAGEIGTPRLFEAHLHYHLEDLDNIRLRKNAGGGGLLDVGCYLVDSAHFLFSDELPQRVSATMQIGSESQVDESCFIQLLYAEGRAAHLSCGTRLERENRYAIYGEKGSLHLSPAYVTPRNKKCRIELRRLGEKNSSIDVPASNQLANQIDAFSAWIQGDTQAAELFNRPLQNAVILDAIRQSATEAREVSLRP